MLEDYKLRDLRASHTGLVVELEHLKIKTRLTNEKFSEDECEIVYYESIKREPKIRGTSVGVIKDYKLKTKEVRFFFFYEFFYYESKREPKIP